MKNQKGITLIALVITIIVLLILARVTIKIVFNKGIIEKSEYAVDTYKGQAVKEKLMLAITEYKMKELAGEIEKGKIVEFLESEGMNVDKTTDENNYIVALDGFSFKVSKNNLMVENNGTTNIPTNPPTQNPPTPPAPTKYTVSLTKGEGIVSVSINGETSAEVEENTEVQISAVVEDGYEFVAWVIEGGVGNINDVTGANSKNATVTPTGEIHLKATAEWNIQTATLNTPVTGTKNATINGQAPAYNNPIIPIGFKAVNDGGVEWGTEDGWDNGLVIKDGDGNEFVWVPACNDVSQDKSTSPYYDTVPYYGRRYFTEISSSSNITSGCSDDEYAIPTAQNGEVVGIANWWTNEGYAGQERGQIEKYGGFYIARYEAYDAGSNKPGSKSEQTVWTDISYTKARMYAKNMYNNTTKYPTVRSGLVTGSMWDTVMRWYEKAGISLTNSSSYGYYSSNSNKTSGGATKYQKKNIYDMAGSVSEWTGEKYSSNFVYRGGNYNNLTTESPVAQRESNPENYVLHKGFRVGLYVE